MESDAKVEQYMVLAKHQHGAALADLLVRAISDPRLFAFSEFVHLPNVQQLRSTDADATLNTLELFAYGTWPDYKAQPDSFLTLDADQSKKLKQLSICTFAQSQKTLQYAHVIEQLELGSVRELEDFIINDCLYPTLLKCKLDQRLGCLYVQDVAPRDVRQQQLPLLIKQLDGWLGNIGSAMSAMKANVAVLQRARTESSALAERHAKAAEAVAASVEQSAAALGGKGALSDAAMTQEDYMMHDDPNVDAPHVPSLGARMNRGHRSTTLGRGGLHGPDAKRRR